MTMEFRAKAKKMAADKLKSYGGKSNKDYMDGLGKNAGGRCGYALGGIVGGSDDGGMAEGDMAPQRMDRPASGKSKGKSGTVVNVIIAGKGSEQPPMPPPAPPPQRVPVPVPTPVVGPPGAGGPPPPGGPGGPGMPPMRAAGGRVGYAAGGTVGCAEVKKELPKISGKKATKMDAGSGGGLGRLEKINDYGKRSS